MKPLQIAIPNVLVQLMRNAPLSAEKIAFAWRAAVGPAMARAAVARLSGDGVLEVACDDDHWRREIRRSMPVIRERLTALLGAGTIKKVKISPGRQANPGGGREAAGGGRPTRA